MEVLGSELGLLTAGTGTAEPRQRVGEQQHESHSESRRMPVDLGGPANLITLGLIAVGLVVRALRLEDNHSLTQSEAMLALNVHALSVAELFTRRLDYLQGGPPGFLVTQKVMTELFGWSEFAHRLFPFVAGSVALVGMYFLARAVLAPFATVIAVAIVSLSEPLVDWAVQGKQYSIDVLATIATLLIAVAVAGRSRVDVTTVAAFTAMALVIWFSHAAVFVTVAVATVVVAGALLRRRWRHALMLAGALAVWGVSLLVLAVVHLDNLNALQGACVGTVGDCVDVAPSEPGSPSDPGTPAFELDDTASLRDSLGELRYVLGIPHFISRGSADLGLFLVACAVGLFALGAWSFVRRRRYEVAAVLLLTIALQMTAWQLGKYPMYGRTQLFLVPIFALLIAEGAWYLRNRSSRVSSSLAVGMTAAILVSLTVHTGRYVVQPPHWEDVKPGARYLSERWRPGDSVYQWYTAQYQLRYYMECECAGEAFQASRGRGLWPYAPAAGGPPEFSPALRSVGPTFVVPRFRGRDAEPYLDDLKRFQGRARAWFFLSSLEDDRTRAVEARLDSLGRRVEGYEAGQGKGAVRVLLYDLSERPRT